MTPNPPRIFISYARKDGRDLALKLKARLEADGDSVWLDTAEIDGGASWSREEVLSFILVQKVSTFQLKISDWIHPVSIPCVAQYLCQFYSDQT